MYLLGIVTNWWKPKEKEGRYIAWKGWNKLCQPRCVDGLGFKKTRELNETLLAKFAWMVASGKQSLCMEVLRSKYKVKEDWLKAEPSKSASPTWRGIERAKKLIEKGACFLVGDGKSINVWVDPWVPWIEEFKTKPRIDDYLQLPLKAHHFIDHASKTWHEDMVKEVFSANDVQEILSIPIPHHPKQDRLIWLPDPKGTFTVKSVHRVAFTQASDGRPVNSLWKDLWKARLPERLKMFLWRIGANVIPTKVNLQRKMQHIDPVCTFCNNEDESSTHVFLDCQFARALWAVVGWGIRFDTATFTSGEVVLKLIINPPDAPIPVNEQWTVNLNMTLILDEIYNSRN